MVFRMRDRLRQQGGFTLVEMLVSTSVLAGGGFAAVGTVETGRGLTVVGETQSVASRIAEREIEGVLRTPTRRSR